MKKTLVIIGLALVASVINLPAQVSNGVPSLPALVGVTTAVWPLAFLGTGRRRWPVVRRAFAVGRRRLLGRLVAFSLCALQSRFWVERRLRLSRYWLLHAHAVGGDLMKGFIAAVAFATILAVVSGLTLSGASAVSHDLYASVFRKGRVDEATEIRVSKITTVILGVVAITLGVLFEKVNVAFMVGLAFAVAASANFPVLFLSMLWSGLTTRGAVIGGFVGLVSALALTVLSPGIWEAVLGYPKGSAWFP